MLIDVQDGGVLFGIGVTNASDVLTAVVYDELPCWMNGNMTTT